jgi:prevent-host-death family protein
MRRPALSRDLVSVHDFRANMASWLRQVGEEGRSVVLTQHGRAAAVLVDPAALDELDEARRVVERVLRGMEDVAEGRLHDDDDVWAEVEQVLAEAAHARPVE